MKMQFHFESKSFANYEDRVYERPVECIETVIDNENECYELLQLCKQIWNEYYELFIPFQERLMDAQQRLSNGENPENVFDHVVKLNNGLYLVKLMRKCNFLRPDGTFVWEGEKWFDSAYSFDNVFTSVYIKGKGYNYFRPDGTLVWKGEKWFDWVGKFDNGFTSVFIEGKGYNFLRPDGTLVWEGERWFDDAYSFDNGLAKVYIKGKGYNYLRLDGTLVWKGDKWFDTAYSFDNGLASVVLVGKYFKLDKDGNLHPLN